MERINKSPGITESEIYLSKLCKKTFLSLWSYPNLYTDESKINEKCVGKELCDLLVLYENNVIIFSDKSIAFKETGNIKVDWGRWFRRAIKKSANQIFGAESWIKKHHERIYIDPYCKQKFPLEIPQNRDLNFYRILVARNSKSAVEKYFGSNSRGSLMLNFHIEGDEHYDNPFMIGQIDKGKGIVHVLDDITLDLVMSELDTIHDFIGYLTEKEKAIEKNIFGIIPGEEELLAYYLLSTNKFGHSGFTIPKDFSQAGVETLMLSEGFWDEYIHSPMYSNRKELFRISYFWDQLIEKFGSNILAGSAAIERDKTIASHEEAVRFMAAEGRVFRTVLARNYLEKAKDTLPNHRSARVLFSPFRKDICYVFLFFSRDAVENYDNYREWRIAYLKSYCFICKMKWPHVRYILALAREPASSSEYSEDVMLLDIPELDEADRQLAEKAMKEDNILKDVEMISLEGHHSQDGEIFIDQYKLKDKVGHLKVGRNDPCICGSDKKFKKCCGKNY